jgi:8-hydroxy-5-deazaflavin:NADPH oxidoreductase
MEITIIGTGNMGRGIATRALAGGHDVTLIGTEIDKAQQLADELGQSGSGSVSAGESPTGELVVLAVWYPGVIDVVRQHADQLDGKVLVDITNPIDTSQFEPLAIDAGSAAEEIDEVAPDGAKVVKAFNTTFAGTLAAGEVTGQQLDVFIAGNDADAKAKVTEVVEAGGLRAIDAGPLRRARELEALGYLHMALQEALGTGYASAVKVIV